LGESEPLTSPGKSKCPSLGEKKDEKETLREGEIQALKKKDRP